MADDVPDIKLIARELVVRGPERLTLIFSSRRQPAVPVARLRARGELAELSTADLRFSEFETETLFKDTYGYSLERDVVADPSARTEGWAASLYLVQAALRDRTVREARAFVKGSSGAHAELYDYLAEEVIGELTAQHQEFLMRTAILQAVEHEPAAIVTGLDAPAAPDRIAEPSVKDCSRVGMNASDAATATTPSFASSAAGPATTRSRRHRAGDASRKRRKLGGVARLADCVLPLRRIR